MYTYRYSRERSEQVSSYCPVCRKQRIWEGYKPKALLMSHQLCCSIHAETYKNYTDNLITAMDNFVCENKLENDHERCAKFFDNLLLTKLNQLKKYSLEIEKVAYVD